MVQLVKPQLHLIIFATIRMQLSQSSHQVKNEGLPKAWLVKII
jgi:hypothetical protein